MLYSEDHKDIRTQAGRLANLAEMRDALLQVIEERAAACADDPRGRTGLFSLTRRIAGSREHPVIIERYTMDRRIPRELRKLLTQAAIECGQWGDKRQNQKPQPPRVSVNFVNADGTPRTQPK